MLYWHPSAHLRAAVKRNSSWLKERLLILLIDILVLVNNQVQMAERPKSSYERGRGGFGGDDRGGRGRGDRGGFERRGGGGPPGGRGGGDRDRDGPPSGGRGKIILG